MGEQPMARGPASWAAPVAVTASAPISWLRDLAALSWSLVTTTAAVGLGVLVVGGVRVGQLGPLAVALAAVTVLDTLVQPLLRPLAAFGSVVLALVLGFGFQVALVLAALRFTPGVSSSGWRDTAAVLLIAAGILAATRWVLGSSDTSY
ncbi:MAG: hypothetical protein WAL50_04035, partial [Kineosporiaceae bacterium]